MNMLLISLHVTVISLLPEPSRKGFWESYWVIRVISQEFLKRFLKQDLERLMTIRSARNRH
ncbi:hypothetical protein PRO82_001754 [Candidatus Protochlamydia amoebophila]|nr:hypothetical protein [Candidatus Protochlamydia amoebophila]